MFIPKKLELSDKKCSKLHIAKGKSDQCPNLKVHNSDMKSSEKEHYLGDIVNENAKPHTNIIDRISKGYGIVANILGLIRDKLGSSMVAYIIVRYGNN